MSELLSMDVFKEASPYTRAFFEQVLHNSAIHNLEFQAILDKRVDPLPSDLHFGIRLTPEELISLRDVLSGSNTLAILHAQPPIVPKHLLETDFYSVERQALDQFVPFKYLPGHFISPITQRADPPTGRSLRQHEFMSSMLASLVESTKLAPEYCSSWYSYDGNKPHYKKTALDQLKPSDPSERKPLNAKQKAAKKAQRKAAKASRKGNR